MSFLSVVLHGRDRRRTAERDDADSLGFGACLKDPAPFLSALARI
jgi:hypothetical protein